MLWFLCFFHPSLVKPPHQHHCPKWIWLQPVLLLEPDIYRMCGEWGSIPSQQQEMGGERTQRRRWSSRSRLLWLLSQFIHFSILCCFFPRRLQSVLGNRATSSTYLPADLVMSYKCVAECIRCAENPSVGVTGVGLRSGDPTTAQVK